MRWMRESPQEFSAGNHDLYKHYVYIIVIGWITILLNVCGIDHELYMSCSWPYQSYTTSMHDKVSLYHKKWMLQKDIICLGFARTQRKAYALIRYHLSSKEGAYASIRYHCIIYWNFQIVREIVLLTTLCSDEMSLATINVVMILIINLGRWLVRKKYTK